MRPTITALRAWDPQVLTTAGSQLDGLTQTFDAQLQAMVRHVDNTQQHWKGEAAAAAGARAAGEATVANHVSTALLGIVDALNAGGPDVASARDHALRVVEDALAYGCSVSDDGTVTAPAARPGSPVAISLGNDPGLAQEVFNQDAQARATDLGRALDTVAAADARLAAALTEALDTLAAAATAPPGEGALSPQAQAIVGGTAQLPADPVALKAFWDTLSPADKDALYDHDHNLGNHDGIPVTDRDHYNRRHLAELGGTAHDTLTGLAAAHPDWAEGRNVPPKLTTENGQPTPEEARLRSDYDAWKSRYDAVKTSSAGYDAVNAGISDELSAQTPKFLMGIDDKGRGIISTGNPDTARNVATFVPGTGSKLSSISGDLERSQRMLDAAATARAPSTAVVTWYGYNAPQGLAYATDSAYAEAGAPALGSFQAGLRATHDGDPSHNVVVGHSYGTTVIGTAASGNHYLDADDIALVGSPGANVGNVSDFNLVGVAPADIGDHAYATSARWDPVPLFSDTGTFGPNPDGPFFGTYKFSSNPGSAGWWAGYNPEVHSQYWDPGNKALTNLGLIIAGHGDRVS